MTDRLNARMQALMRALAMLEQESVYRRLERLWVCDRCGVTAPVRSEIRHAETCAFSVLDDVEARP